jgi:hypothetical protein
MTDYGKLFITIVAAIIFVPVVSCLTCGGCAAGLSVVGAAAKQAPVDNATPRK